MHLHDVELFLCCAEQNLVAVSVRRHYVLPGNLGFERVGCYIQTRVAENVRSVLPKFCRIVPSLARAEVAGEWQQYEHDSRQNQDTQRSAISAIAPRCSKG